MLTNLICLPLGFYRFLYLQTISDFSNNILPIKGRISENLGNLGFWWKTTRSSNWLKEEWSPPEFKYLPFGGLCLFSSKGQDNILYLAGLLWKLKITLLSCLTQFLAYSSEVSKNEISVHLVQILLLEVSFPSEQISPVISMKEKT